ncbi:unnamed protein product [Mytilus coruscus]|uniref:Uncharacterized protein n=1 Tax=Mytilus coruscus TaxID=42192 RepID=A0A6J8CNC2_MYTCO|nr:unnamed protein product [Mytilus coruscus]
MYKAINGMISLPETDIIINKSDNQTRGANRLRQICTAKTEVYKQSFFPRTIQNWNQLPTMVTNSATLDDFKRTCTPFRCRSSILGFFPAAVTLSFMPVGDAPSIPNTKQSINSITQECPRTQKDWDDRAYEICPDNKTLYHCLYERNCSLVEVCRAPQGTNVETVLLDSSDNIFFNKWKNKIYSNSIDYWMIQYFYCHKHFNNSNPLLIVKRVKTTEKTIEKRPWEYDFAWSLVGVLLVSLIAIVCFFNRHSCLSILQSAYQFSLNCCYGCRQGQDSDKKENVHTAESCPPGNQPSSTVDRNCSSLNNTNNIYTAVNVDVR